MTDATVIARLGNRASLPKTREVPAERLLFIRPRRMIVSITTCTDHIPTLRR